MELNLRTVPIRNTAVLARFTLPVEEGGDIIVPDSLPDIVRIIETNAHLYLRSKDLRGSKLYVEASAQVDAMYVPESGGGLCRLSVTLPMTATFDLDRPVEPNTQIFVHTELVQTSARELNPRKLAVRVAAEFRCTVYAERDVLMRVGVESDAVETLLQTTPVRLTEGLYEKQLNITDSVELPSDLADETEILKYEAVIRTVERKQIKNKIVLKGELALSLLAVCGDERSIRPLECAVPFAGVVDCVGVDETSTVDTVCTPGSCELKIVRESGTDRPLLAVKADLQITAEAWTETELSYLADAYGIGKNAACEWEEQVFSRPETANEIRLSICENMQCGLPVRKVYLCGITAGKALIHTDDGNRNFETECTLRLVFEAEDGGIYALTQNVPLQVPGEADSVASIKVDFLDKTYHIYDAETVEVKATAVFRICPQSEVIIRQISRVDLCASAEQGSRVPALTLCYAENGETLWQLGKRLGAGLNDIRSVNALEDDRLPSGKLLLIPRRGYSEGRM